MNRLAVALALLCLASCAGPQPRCFLQPYIYCPQLADGDGE